MSPASSSHRPGRARRGSALVLLAVLTLLPAAFATTYLELTIDEMLARAEIAIYAEVVAVETELRNGLPWTVVTFAPSRDLLDPPEATADVEAAEAPLDDVQLAFLGGDPDDGGPTLIVNLMPVFEVGEQVVVLAYRDEYASPIVGFRQGLWRDSALGLIDETGRILSLDDESNLLLDGGGAGLEAVLQAFERSLNEDTP